MTSLISYCDVMLVSCLDVVWPLSGENGIANQGGSSWQLIITWFISLLICNFDRIELTTLASLDRMVGGCTYSCVWLAWQHAARQWASTLMLWCVQPPTPLATAVWSFSITTVTTSTTGLCAYVMGHILFYSWEWFRRQLHSLVTFTWWITIAVIITSSIKSDTRLTELQWFMRDSHILN